MNLIDWPYYLTIKKALGFDLITLAQQKAWYLEKVCDLVLVLDVLVNLSRLETTHYCSSVNNILAFKLRCIVSTHCFRQDS
jgi:hypothetical protein